MSNIDNVKVGMFTYKDKDYNFNFYTDIGISKKISLINNVVDTIVTENHYQSVLRGLIFGFQLINVFSDALSNFADEEKTFTLAEIEDIVTNTKIVDIIMANAKVGLIDELQNAIDKDIEYKTGIHINPLGEAVASLLGTLEQRVKDIDLEDLIGFAKAFKDISGENLTFEKMFDAYAKSEAFKKVRDEADERNAEKIAKVINIVGKGNKATK